MDVYDTNVWVCGLTSQVSAAEHLIDEVVQGSRDVVVDAYIFQETLDAFDNSYHSTIANQHQQDFAALVSRNNSINGPTQAAVSRMNVKRVQRNTSVRLISTSFGIQAKDVPILCLAYEYRSTSPTIYTCDGPFSNCNPANHGLPDISIHQVR